MPKTTRQLEDTKADPKELDVKNRGTGVTFETKDFKVTASVAAGRESGTSSDGQDEDYQNETCLSVSLSPKGIRTSRRRPKIMSRCSPVQKRMRTVEEEPMLTTEAEAAQVAAQEKENRPEVPQKARCEISDIIMLVLLILIVFMVFMHLILALVVTVHC